MANETVAIYQQTDNAGNPVAPKTPMSAVYDQNGDKLDDILAGLDIVGKTQQLNTVTQDMLEEIEDKAESAIQGAVKVTAQSFTVAQKAQARKNIGATRAGAEIGDPVGAWEPKSAQQYINEKLAKVNSNISGLQGQINTEKGVREAEDLVLSNKIDTVESDINDRIDTIVGDGTGSLGDLQNKITTETQNRLDAESNIVNELNECARLAPDDGTAVIPDFNPYTDTLHKTEQSLTFNEKKAVNGNLVISGTSANRPSDVVVGFQFFDTTLNPARPIWWNGSAWVDATGTAV